MSALKRKIWDTILNWLYHGETIGKTDEEKNTKKYTQFNFE